MNLADANDIIARRNAGDESVSLHEWSAASAYVGSYYTFERPDLLRPATTTFTTDAKPPPSTTSDEKFERALAILERRAKRTTSPKRIRDAEAISDPHDRTLNAEPGASVETADPPGRVGPARVMRLSPVTQYSILADTEGDGGWLVRHASIENAAGEHTGAVRDAGYYQRQAKTARTARELATIGLRSINEANMKAWGNG